MNGDLLYDIVLGSAQRAFLSCLRVDRHIGYGCFGSCCCGGGGSSDRDCVCMSGYGRERHGFYCLSLRNLDTRQCGVFVLLLRHCLLLLSLLLLLACPLLETHSNPGRTIANQSDPQRTRTSQMEPERVGAFQSESEQTGATIT